MNVRLWQTGVEYGLPVKVLANHRVACGMRVLVGMTNKYLRWKESRSNAQV